MLFFFDRCECFDDAASSQCKEFLKRPSSVLQAIYRKGSIPRICCKVRDLDGAWRMADMMIIDATKKGHCPIGSPCILVNSATRHSRP